MFDDRKLTDRIDRLSRDMTTSAYRPGAPIDYARHAAAGRALHGAAMRFALAGAARWFTGLARGWRVRRGGHSPLPADLPTVPAE